MANYIKQSMRERAGSSREGESRVGWREKRGLARNRAVGDH
jgi:hypothetical protein